MPAFSDASSLPVTWQRWRSHHSIRRSRKPHTRRKPHGSICYRTGVMGDRSSHCGNRHFKRFRLLWPWPWPDDLHILTWPYWAEIYRMCKYELRTSRFSKIIVWQTYAQLEMTYHVSSGTLSLYTTILLQTYRIDHYKARRFAGAQNIPLTCLNHKLLSFSTFV